ncbi:hypothetical protein ACJX0J_022219, partial [Zea mays]
SPLLRGGLVLGQRLMGFRVDEIGCFVSFFVCEASGWDRHQDLIINARSYMHTREGHRHKKKLPTK